MIYGRQCTGIGICSMFIVLRIETDPYKTGRGIQSQSSKFSVFNVSGDIADYQFVLKKIKIKINGNLTKKKLNIMVKAETARNCECRCFKCIYFNH